MSILAQQLNKLKQNNGVSIAPGAPRVSLILDKQTAKNTTVDVLYTMAVMGFAELKKVIFHNGKDLGEELLSESNKQINRNKLTKETNKALSLKITRFLLIISPFFLNKSCQTIIQYLIRNYSVHIFESEQVALIFLQFWQQQSYAKLVSTLEIKTPTLNFLKPFQNNQSVNLSYIVKSLTYSRSLIQTLITFVKRYIKQQNYESEEIQIQLISRPTSYKIQIQKGSQLVKRDFKIFILFILSEILKRKIEGFEKQIAEFCVFITKQQNEDAMGMAMTISILLLENEKTHSSWIRKVISNLLSKSNEIATSTFNFILIVWQRWPFLINHETIQCVIQKQQFLSLISQNENSLYIVFFTIFHYVFESEADTKGIALQIMKSIVLKIKEEQFVELHEDIFWAKIFEIFEGGFEKIQRKVQSPILKFISQFLAYQYAVYCSTKNKKPIQGIYRKEQIIGNGIFNWKQLPKTKMETRPKELGSVVENKMEQQSSEEEIDQQNKTGDKRLASFFFSNLKSDENVDLTNPKHKNIAKSLLNVYYGTEAQQIQNNEDNLLSIQQKNKLLQDQELFNQQYKEERFIVDFEKRDYHTALRYLIKQGTISNCFIVLSRIGGDIEAAKDILYRQISRQAIFRLSFLAKQHYKSVMNTLGKLYQQYCKNTQVQLLKILNQTMLKISQSVLESTGRQKGKFFKLISCHNQFLANLTVSHIYGQTYALQTYKKLISIFGQSNEYCFVIGIANVLATKVKNKKYFANFIDRVFIPSLSQIQNLQTENYQNVKNLLETVKKCLIFSWHTLQEQIPQKKQPPQKIFEQAIGKKMITNYFGMAHPKNKKSVIRKVLLFFTSLFKSFKVSAIFKNTISVISRKQEIKLTSLTTKIYSILSSINENSRGPVQQSSQNIMTNLLKLYPLQLKIDILGPLLPRNSAYQELSNDLSESSVKKFENLQYFVNIVPEQASEQWSKFVSQCLKRSYIPNKQTCEKILSLFGQGNQNTFIIKFICELTQFAKEQSLEILQKIMSVILIEAKQSNNYSLAIFYRLTANLKDLLDPYLPHIFKIAIQVKQNYVNKFIDQIVQSFSPPVLISLIKTQLKQVQNFFNFSYFLEKVSEKVNFQPIWKLCQNFFSYSISTLVQNSQPLEKLIDGLANVFSVQVLKMNDNQLRKILIDYVRWSSQKTSADNSHEFLFNSRKTLLLLIYHKLSQKLGQLFNQYYGYIFEDIIKDLKALTVMQDKKSLVLQKGNKRNRQTSEYTINFLTTYTSLTLRCLKSLFDHDPNNQFMDSIKFDMLAPSLANIFNYVRFDFQYNGLITNGLYPCLISLFKNTLDDYKLKTISTEILRSLKSKDQRVVQAIYGFYDQVIGHIDYRFLIFSDEMIPLLLEASSSRSVSIKKLVDSLIYKIQNLSGQKIDRINR